MRLALLLCAAVMLNSAGASAQVKLGKKYIKLKGYEGCDFRRWLGATPCGQSYPPKGPNDLLLWANPGDSRTTWDLLAQAATVRPDMTGVPITFKLAGRMGKCGNVGHLTASSTCSNTRSFMGPAQGARWTLYKAAGVKDGYYIRFNGRPKCPAVYLGASKPKGRAPACGEPGLGLYARNGNASVSLIWQINYPTSASPSPPPTKRTPPSPRLRPKPPSPKPKPALPGRAGLIAPAKGAWLGMAIDYSKYGNTIANYEAKLGRQPASHIIFMSFPLSDGEVQNVQGLMTQLGARKAIVILTLEPYGGLDLIDQNALSRLSTQLAAWEQLGVIGIIRFAHEMNGSWYPWAQKPTQYKAVWRRVAKVVKASTCKMTMLWAPNEGGGYPFSGGPHELKCNKTQISKAGSDCAQLDNNKNGYVDQGDDMYSPYYPGDDVVDWVGLSVYHFGAVYPWGANNVPEAAKFYEKITGTYNGAGGDQSNVPDFYDTFCRKRGKPMVIGETAALFNLCDKGGRGCGAGDPKPKELTLKGAWWRQVYATSATSDGPSIAANFPMIKIINWFDFNKPEGEAEGNIVDWSVSTSTTIKAQYIKFVEQAPTMWQWLPTLKSKMASLTCSDFQQASSAVAAADASPIQPQPGGSLPHPIKPIAGFTPFPRPLPF